jgi:hypothetical protein
MGPDACLYKQSQFHRLGDGQEGRGIAPFHYSIVPPSQSDADCAKQSQFTRRCRAQLCKQTQSGVPGREEGCRCEQTKPNLGDPGYLGNGVEGLVQTNPIWRDAPAGLRARVRLYKQTQFRRVATGLALQTNPICPARWAGGAMAGADRAKQTQFLGTGWTRGSGCTNKANFRRPRYATIPLFQAAAYRAKQTQSPADGMGAGVPCPALGPASLSPGGRTNKPNRSRQAGKTIVTAGSLGDATPQRSYCVKQTQFPAVPGGTKRDGGRNR